MTRETRRRRWRWLRHILVAKASLILLAIVTVLIFFGSGAGNPLLRRYVIHKLELSTGGRAELRTISIRWWSLQARLRGLVIHGKEPAGTEPLFAAEEIRVGLRIDSFWGRKVSLDELYLGQPSVHLRVDKDGKTNLPPFAASRSSREFTPQTLLDLHIRKVQIENGWLLYNDVRTPLGVEGNELFLTLDASGSADHPLYAGDFAWKSVKFTALSFFPAPTGISAKFTVWREGFRLEQGIVNTEHSHLDAQADMQNFAQPRWTFRYRGWVNLLDLRETLRSSDIPTGRADVRGEGSYAGGKLATSGSYSGEDIALSYLPYFHAKNVTSRGSFHMDNAGIDVPDFFAQALGGRVTGRVKIRFDGMQFRADTHVQDVPLASLFPSIEHRGFPIDELHWDSVLTADTVETWSGPFRHFEIGVKMQWTSPDEVAEGHTPVDGEWQFRYRYDPGTLSIDSGEFETPESRGFLSGILAPRDTALDLRFETGSLENYRDFINAIRGAAPHSTDEIKTIAGSITWDGKISGPAGSPTFSGHLRGERVRYENIALDFLDGDLTYSQDELTLSRGRLRDGAIDTNIELALALSDWSFDSDNTWSADLSFGSTPLDALQQFLGTHYPARGNLSGQFHGRGTRQHPALTGLFDLSDGSVYDVVFNRLRGQLNASAEEVRIANAELRLFAPGKEAGRGAGIVTGTAGYNLVDHTVSADLVGASLPLANFEKLQSARLPVDGQVTFRLKASGPLDAPRADGTFRVVDLKVGQTIIGSFDGELNSDGQTARLKLGSAMSTGELSGNLTLGLSQPFPLEGKIAIHNISLDPFLFTALHLKDFDGHGVADGEIAISGNLQHPESLVADTRFSRLVFTYQNVRLENSEPVHFRSSRDALQIESATFRGTDTDIKVAGNVQFSNGRSINLRLNGALDLRLIASMAPGMSGSGSAQVNAVFEGTLDRPHITGRIHIENASARAADFPTGLSAIKGDLIFDANRLYFDNLTAEAGGGTLRLAGTVNYTERPLRYDITARSDGTRIRYPEGMSWLTAGSLRLAGTTNGGVLSGRVTVERVSLSQGLESAGSLVSSKEGISAPTTTSPFLRNLQFDVEAVSAPDARMQWPGAELEAEANLRVRGTWEHPIVLGHIHVLSGELLFHGNRYKVARGDINFANPFRLDPVINVEASTTIQQYEITLNFTGPSSKLSLAYRSDPPLPGNDIVTLLALGQTSAEGTSRSAGGAQGGASGASALLSEAVSSQLGGRLEKLFGITNFRVDPGLTGVGTTGSGQNAAARVTVQQQVTRNVTVTYVSNVGSTQQQVIQVEYNVNRNISIVALRDYNGTFGIDIKIKKRFP